MKLVLAFGQPYKLDAVTRALEYIPRFPWMTVTNGRGFGREKLAEPHSARESLTDFTDKVRIETVVNDEQVDDVLVSIMNAAYTGQAGDGKIVVLPVEQALRIRTMAEGEEAV